MWQDNEKAPPRPERERELPVLGEWPYDEETVGIGFFPEEVGLRRVRPDRPAD
ncbi:hypothetical protein OJ998_00895 [Solirubrobacter taibaiensis]|nr:hypothetical protein [Solirubrobacter taibaiensis]